MCCFCVPAQPLFSLKLASVILLDGGYFLLSFFVFILMYVLHVSIFNVHIFEGLECSSVPEHLTSMFRPWGSIPSTTRKQKTLVLYFLTLVHMYFIPYLS